ncbi:hypothetical protein Tco_0848188 [Tanacetum coccineum]
MWEEFIQTIQKFLTDKANLGSPTKKGRKDKPHIIPCYRFTKLIIYHLVRTHNIHQRSTSPFHLAEEDLRLGNLKFIPKGKDKEVFGMTIPNELISNNIRNAPYYNVYLEMKSSKPAPTPKSKVSKEKPSKPSTAKPTKSKPAKEKSTKATPLQKAGKGKVAKVRNATRPLPVVEGKGKAIVTEEHAAQSLLTLHTPKRRSTTDQFIFQRQTPATEEVSTRPSAQPQDDTSANVVRDSPSPADAETGANTNKINSGGDTEILQIGEEQGDETNMVNLEEKTDELDQGQGGLDPGKTLESRPPPEQVFMEEDQAGPDPGVSRVALAGPNPEPTHEEFMTHVFLDVHERLKFLADEHVILEEPLSSSKTLSSMKNLDDAYTIGDQLINDKSTEDELGKLNMESEVVSMITVLIHQSSSSVPPLSTPVIDLSSSSKHVSSATQAPIFIATTTTTTTTPPPPPQQQSSTDSELAARVQHLNINSLNRFRELPEADMKEILHQRMFETGTNKSLPEHVALYEALEASMERANMDELLAKKDKSRKRQRDDQDPPPPPPNSNLNKKKRHDSSASGSSQPPAPQLSAWKTTDTRETPLSSPKQQSGPHAEQPVEDIPMPDTANISNSKDTDSSHLPKIKQRLEWLKPIPEEDRIETPEPDWSIPPNDLPEPENNWANVLANSYKDPEENKLLRKTSDMGSFCR